MTNKRRCYRTYNSPLVVGILCFLVFLSNTSAQPEALLDSNRSYSELAASGAARFLRGEKELSLKLFNLSFLRVKKIDALKNRWSAWRNTLGYLENASLVSVEDAISLIENESPLWMKAELLVLASTHLGKFNKQREVELLSKVESIIERSDESPRLGYVLVLVAERFHDLKDSERVERAIKRSEAIFFENLNNSKSPKEILGGLLSPRYLAESIVLFYETRFSSTKAERFVSSIPDKEIRDILSERLDKRAKEKL